MRRHLLLLLTAAAVVTSTAAVCGFAARGGRWSAKERETLRSLSLATLGPLPADPSNRYADDSAAAQLGHALFFDTRLSGNGNVSCATCHIPDQGFQDGLALAKGVGTPTRRTMPIAGTAYSPWQFWDGRADSQWGQALGPLESPVEHGGDRAAYAKVIASAYRAEYESVFGPLPKSATRREVSRVYANMGKAIAAYERRIGFAPSRFDRYVEAELAGRQHTTESAFTTDEEAGLKLFIGKGNCVNCHNGSLLTDNHFHNTGVAAVAGLPADSGRATGVRLALSGEFNCTSEYSDAKPEECEELNFAVTEGEELVRAYKTPSLRNVAARAPYMHAGQIATLEEVVAHYDAAPAAPAGHSELKPLRLSARERSQLVAFLRTLSSALVAPRGFLQAPTK